ncbi:MAG: hypothetical protein CSA89_01100 [Bacteroidales bacterium]|nr:MAG: hypothetical protein CSA89_01100 [Bacteroidales bacterium]
MNKKRLKTSLAILYVLITITTSCSKPNAEIPLSAPDIKEDVISLISVYYDSALIDNKYAYKLSFASKSAYDDNRKLVADGRYYAFVLLVSKRGTNTENPPLGKYQLSESGDEMTVLIANSPKDNPRTYCATFTKEASFSAPTPFVDGELTLSETTITFRGKTNSGTELIYEFDCPDKLNTLYYKDAYK